MRNSTLLYGRVLLWIALQDRIFGAARVEWKHAFTMPSRDKNNLKVNLNYNLNENLLIESLTKMKSEVWSLKSDGLVFVILR